MLFLKASIELELTVLSERPFQLFTILFVKKCWYCLFLVIILVSLNLCPLNLEFWLNLNKLLTRAFHNLAFSEFLCSLGVLLFHFMMWNHCNFFRFLKLILDHPHGGQRSQRSVCAPENANFFIYWVTELIFVSKDFIFQDNHFDIQEV